MSPDQRRDLIRRTFRSVAPRYDLMNDLMSLGIHRWWKASFVAMADPKPGEVVVDVAGGTGDVARLLVARGAIVTVVDPSAEMMSVGRARPGAGGITWVEGEAEVLPLADTSVDLVTVAFGIRNVTRIEDALAEIHRVLKPGGRFHCLEFSTPQRWLAPLYEAWSRTAIPALGAAVSGRIEAYRYLVESIRRFPDQRQFADLIGDAGFSDVSWRDLSFGIAAVHRAIRDDRRWSRS
ncbi:class I SAM-dependent methyltransferase [Rhodoplanes sp.]|uniref:class I SAM-dependent methyltransferase n=1 Tax=Rhodoplanes sp. TaxID=1968906 RepID=UPI0025ED71F9|nr:class I SAM-dependent methyltransferase [Rhodoplanes sp.]